MRRREAQFRLRDVGARHLSDIEAVARLLQRCFQHVDVAALKLEDRVVAQQIHVGDHGVQQHGLLGHAQRFARGEHLRLGLPRAVAGLEAVVTASALR